MNQTLDIQIKIPDDHVLITKENYQHFLEQQLIGRSWNMKQLEEHTNRSGQWLRKNILEVPDFRDELSEFVSFPQRQGQAWKFGALKMSQWLEENQELIFGRSE